MLDLAIISKPLIKDNKEYFLAGDNYLDYISFLGCSPCLNFEPAQNITLSLLKETIADLNYIQFYFNSGSYCFKKTPFGVKAVCPLCKTKIKEWKELITNWENNSNPDTICPQCHQVISIINIDWKKTAGFFQTAILLYGVQAELAIPTDNFLTQLENITRVKWHYFYG